jgi:hypothetical protein
VGGGGGGVCVCVGEKKKEKKKTPHWLIKESTVWWTAFVTDFFFS